MMNGKIFQIDILRALCAIYIIGIWHLTNYLDPSVYSFGRAYPYMNYLTISVLSTFTFCSGFLLSKYEFASLKDVSSFYKRRLIRLYPLFLLSGVTMYIIGYADLKQVIDALLGVSLFTASPIKTLWFISMCFFLYGITPLVRIGVKWKFNVLCILVLLTAISFLCFKDIVDFRLLMYVPIYVIGLNLRNFKSHINKLQLLVITLISISLLLISFLVIDKNESIAKLIGSICGCAFIVSLAFLCPHPKKMSFLSQIVSWFAYSSLIAYLFHRQFFAISLYLLGQIYMSLPIALMTLSVTFVMSWLMQKVYDRIISYRMAS